MNNYMVVVTRVQAAVARVEANTEEEARRFAESMMGGDSDGDLLRLVDRTAVQNVTNLSAITGASNDPLPGNGYGGLPV